MKALNLYFVSILILVFSNLSAQDVDSQKIDKKNSQEKTEKKKKERPEKVPKTKPEKEIKICHGNSKDGIKEGHWKCTSVDGNIISKGKYINGVKTDKWIEYFPAIDNLQVDYWKDLIQKDVLTQQGDFQQFYGLISDQTLESAQKKSEQNGLAGYSLEGIYVEGKREGVWEVRTGQYRMHKRTYLNDQLDGPYETYKYFPWSEDDFQEISVQSGIVENGIREGEWKFTTYPKVAKYDGREKVLYYSYEAKINFINGKKQGRGSVDLIYFSKTGEMVLKCKKAQFVYKNDKLSGRYHEFQYPREHFSNDHKGRYEYHLSSKYDNHLLIDSLNLMHYDIKTDSIFSEMIEIYDKGILTTSVKNNKITRYKIVEHVYIREDIREEGHEINTLDKSWKKSPLQKFVNFTPDGDKERQWEDILDVYPLETHIDSVKTDVFVAKYANGFEYRLIDSKFDRTVPGNIVKKEIFDKKSLSLETFYIYPSSELYEENKKRASEKGHNKIRMKERKILEKEFIEGKLVRVRYL